MMKTCSKCKLEFPKTLEFFHKQLEGLNPACKSCRSVEKKAHYKNNSEKVKQARKVYYKENFEKISAKSKIHNEENSEKISALRKVHYKKNSDRLLAEKKEYYAKNKDKIKAKNKIYHEANKDIRNAANKAWYLANPERAKANKKAYRLANPNPEKRRGYDSKRRALKLGNGHTPYTEAEMLERYGTVCYLCNEEIDLKALRASGAPGYEKSLWKDHVLALTNGGPDTLDNVKPSHAICNQLKGTKEQYEN